MTAETDIEIHASEVIEVVDSVFSTMMDLRVFPCGEPWLANEERITSAVHLTGQWCGAVLLECTREQACKFASRFLAAGEEHTRVPGNAPVGIVDDVVRDVLGELANMIGGNLKCVLARGTCLSMPSVVDGDYSLRVCGAFIQERQAFRCDEGVFWITVLAAVDRTVN